MWQWQKAWGALVVVVAVLALGASGGSAPALMPQGNPMTSDPPLLRAFDLTNGSPSWTAKLSARPGFVQVAGAAANVVVALEFPCDPEVGPRAVTGFDAATGERLWSRPTRSLVGLAASGGSPVNPGLGASPRGVVYVEVRTSDDRAIKGVDLRSGKPLWEVRGNQENSWPLAANRTIVVMGPHPNLVEPTFGAPEQSIRVLDRRTGDVRWERKLRTDGARSLGAAATRKTVVAQVDNLLTGFDLATGRELWSTVLPVPDGAYNQARIGAAEGVVIVSQDAGLPRITTSGVDAATGQVLWSGQSDSLVQSSQPIERNALATVFPESGPLSIAGFDPRTGTHQWSTTTPGFPGGIGPLSSNRWVVVPQAQALAVVNPSDGSELRTITPPATSKSGIIAGNQLVFAGGCGPDPEQGG